MTSKPILHINPSSTRSTHLEEMSIELPPGLPQSLKPQESPVFAALRGVGVWGVAAGA